MVQKKIGKRKGKLSLHDMQAYGRVAVRPHSFLTSAKDGGELSV